MCGNFPWKFLGEVWFGWGKSIIPEIASHPSTCRGSFSWISIFIIAWIYWKPKRENFHVTKNDSDKSTKRIFHAVAKLSELCISTKGQPTSSVMNFHFIHPCWYPNAKFNPKCETRKSRRIFFSIKSPSGISKRTNQATSELFSEWVELEVGGSRPFKDKENGK